MVAEALGVPAEAPGGVGEADALRAGPTGVDGPGEEDLFDGGTALAAGDGGDVDLESIIAKAKRRRLLPGAAQSDQVFRCLLAGYRTTWSGTAPEDVAAALRVSRLRASRSLFGCKT